MGLPIGGKLEAATDETWAELMAAADEYGEDEMVGPVEVQSPPSFKDADVCWDFVAGRCKKGAACRWLHANSDAAKRAAERALAKLGRNLPGDGASEAHNRLAQLFLDVDMLDSRTQSSTTTIREEFSRHLKWKDDHIQGICQLHIRMGRQELDNDRMILWAHWFDQLLTGKAPKCPIVALVDFSGNRFGDTGISVLCSLFEKHSVSCKILNLAGNSFEESSFRDLSRYLTSSEEASVEKVVLTWGRFSVRALAWLLASISLHPAYPVKCKSSGNYKPLQLHLEPDDSQAAVHVMDDDLIAILQDLIHSCHISIVVGQAEAEVPVATGTASKSNCVAHFSNSTMPSGVDLPSPSSYARPFFLDAPAPEESSTTTLRYTNRRMLPCVLFEDDHFAVVYKPGGWGCHLQSSSRGVAFGGSQSASNVNADESCFKSWLRLTLGSDPAATAASDPEADYGLCHRLDIGTSGPMLVGKTLAGYEAGKLQLRDRDVVKDYVALVHGRLRTHVGTCRARIDRSSYVTEGKVKVSDSGQIAATLYEVLAEYESPHNSQETFSLVHCRLITGRTHQIRAHMACLGHALVGDWRYVNDHQVTARDQKICGRIFLHKFRVTFTDLEGFPVSISCPLSMDPDLWNCLKQLRLIGGLAVPGSSDALGTPLDTTQDESCEAKGFTSGMLTFPPLASPSPSFASAAGSVGAVRIRRASANVPRTMTYATVPGKTLGLGLGSEIAMRSAASISGTESRMLAPAIGSTFCAPQPKCRPPLRR